MTNYLNLLCSPELETVVNTSLTSTHFQIAKDALKSGKHLLIKGLLPDPSYKAEKLKLVTEKGLVSYANHIMMYCLCVQKNCELFTVGVLEISYTLR